MRNSTASVIIAAVVSLVARLSCRHKERPRNLRFMRSSGPPKGSSGEDRRPALESHGHVEA
jgi:hypothetical protein